MVSTHNGVCWLVSLIALVAGLWWWSYPPDVPFLMPDSGSYLRFDSTRGTGYPLLLDLMQSVSGKDSWIKAVQLGFMLVAFSWFSLEAARFFEARWIALPIQIALVFNPLLMRFAFTVLTEAFFIFFLAIWLIACLRMQKSGGRGWAILAAFSFAWMWLIKSLALVWLPAMVLVLFWIAKKEGWRKAAWDILLFALVVSLVQGAGAMYRHSHVNNREKVSFMGSQLFGKMAFIPIETETTDYPESVSRLNELMAEVRDIRNSLPDYRQRFIFSENFYDYIRFQHSDDILAEFNGNEVDKEMELSWSEIWSNSGAYLDEVVMTMVAMWSMGELQTHQFASKYNQLLDKMSNRLPADVELYRPSGRSIAVVIAVKGFMLTAFLISIWAFIYFLPGGRVDKTSAQREMVFALLVMSVAAYAYVVGVSLFQTALIRYELGMWPILLLLVFGGLAVVGRSLFPGSSRV